jgi:hypothetical protein
MELRFGAKKGQAFEHISSHLLIRSKFHSSWGTTSGVSLRYVGTSAGSQNSCLAISPVQARVGSGEHCCP